MFGPHISFIPFHSIFLFFLTFLISKSLHSILFFFNYFFQFSKSLYNIFKSQPFIQPRNYQSQTILTSFLQIIFKPFQTIFKQFFPFQKIRWNCQNDHPKQGDVHASNSMVLCANVQVQFCTYFANVIGKVIHILPVQGISFFTWGWY